MVQACVRTGGDGGAAPGLAGYREGGRRAGHRADRFRQDALRVPVRHRPADEPCAGGGGGGRLPLPQTRQGRQGAVYLAVEGAGRGRGAQSGNASGGHRRPMQGHGPQPAVDPRGHAQRRHHGAGAAGHRLAPAGHPGHHARIVVSAAHLQGAAHPVHGAHRHRGRDPCHRRHQTRGASGVEPGTAGYADRRTRTAHRTVSHGASGRGRGAVPRWRAGRHHRRRAVAPRHGTQGGRTGRADARIRRFHEPGACRRRRETVRTSLHQRGHAGHDETRRAAGHRHGFTGSGSRSAAGACRRRGGGDGIGAGGRHVGGRTRRIGMACRGAQHPQRDPQPPHHARVRQFAWVGGTAHRAAQRPVRRHARPRRCGCASVG